jgi:hypothetical protein
MSVFIVAADSSIFVDRLGWTGLSVVRWASKTEWPQIACWPMNSPLKEREVCVCVCVCGTADLELPTTVRKMPLSVVLLCSCGTFRNLTTYFFLHINPLNRSGDHMYHTL